MESNRSYSRFARFLCTGIIAALFLNGCVNLDPAPDRTRFYVLSAPGAPSAERGANELAVRRVELPEYIDNSKLVVRLSDQEVRYHPYHRWSGPLDSMIARALAEALTRARPDLNVSAGALGGASPAISLRILRFEALPEGVVEVSFDWRLSGSGESSVGRGGQIIRRGTWDESDYGALVEEYSRLLQNAAEELAGQLPPVPPR